MRSFVLVLASAHLLSSAASPLLLLSRDSTNLDVRRTLYPRTNRPKIHFPQSVAASSAEGQEISHTYSAYYDNKLDINHEAKTAPSGKHVRLTKGWSKRPGEVRDHVSLQLTKGTGRFPGKPVGAPTKVPRKFTVNFDKQVPHDDKPSIEAALRRGRTHFHSDDAVHKANVANVVSGWSLPTGNKRPVVAAEFLSHPQYVESSDDEQHGTYYVERHSVPKRTPRPTLTLGA